MSTNCAGNRGVLRKGIGGGKNMGTTPLERAVLLMRKKVQW
jgi:hypothetical protein